MLGKGSVHADKYFRNGFIGTDYAIDEDLKDQFHDRFGGRTSKGS
jgi:hypothetical protein